MNITENKLEELSFIELTEIVGGGFFYDLGAAAHRTWNTLRGGKHGELMETYQSYVYY